MERFICPYNFAICMEISDLLEKANKENLEANIKVSPNYSSTGYTATMKWYVEVSVDGEKFVEEITSYTFGVNSPWGGIFQEQGALKECWEKACTYAEMFEGEDVPVNIGGKSLADARTYLDGIDDEYEKRLKNM